MSKIKQIWQQMIDDAKEVEGCFVAFGYLLIVGYVGFYFFNLLIATPTSHENLVMRIIIALLGLGLILKDQWPNSAKSLMPIYWYITLVYSLPFFFFFMLFHNPESNIWQINALVGIVTLTFFVDWLIYIGLMTIGILLAYIAFYLSNDLPHLSTTLLGVFGSYSAPVIYLVLFSHKRKKLYQERQLVEVKEFNTQLVKQSAELKKALAIKTEFLNNLSHEVRTPISGVVNISELLLENWHKYSEDERYQSMQTIALSGNRLVMVMNSILDLSKFTSGKMSMDMSRGSLEESVRDMIAECESLYLRNKNIIIETNIPTGLNSNILMDKERITQVLRNLVGNAVKFIDSGTIKISLRKQGHNLEVVVEDDGIGIPEDELEDIFYPFVQSSNTKNKAGGTGLGLAICKEIITAHHGKIWAENKHNKGSSFHFLLPQSKAMQNTPILPHILNKSAKATALMIDDDEICHNIIHMILKNNNYDVISTYGGVEGLDYLRTHKNEIDFVLLDLMMPDMHGMTVLKEIKSDETMQHIPIIVQSASNDKDEHHKALDLGAAGFFRKPYDHKSIILFIENMLKKDK